MSQQHSNSGSAARSIRRTMVSAITALGVGAVITLAAVDDASARSPHGSHATPPHTHVTDTATRKGRTFDMDAIAREAKPLKLPKVGKPRGEERSTGKPLVVPGSRAGQRVAQPGTALTRGSTAGATTAQNPYWGLAYNVNPNRQVGKLFFDIRPGPGEVWSSCTATVINSENRSTVLTAGHCVYSPDPDGNGYVTGNGFWHENIRFCPGYENGCRLGIWYARNMVTTPTWFYGLGSPARYEWGDDVAFITVDSHPTKGRIADAQGSHGMAFTANGPARGPRWHPGRGDTVSSACLCGEQCPSRIWKGATRPSRMLAPWTLGSQR